MKFIAHNIISQFGIPIWIISYDGMNFKNKDMQIFCYRYNINHNFSIPYYPQGNGEMKAKNKPIMEILWNIISISHRDWYTQILLNLWAYRNSICTPIGATPLSLVYQTKAMMHLEIYIPSFILQYILLEPKVQHDRLDQLVLLDVRHVNALKHFKV